MADHRLRDATPFVEYLRADTRAQLSAALGFPLDLGAVPLCELAGAEQRDQVAQALASPVVEDLPATPLGDLLPTLRESGEELVSRLHVDARMVRALQQSPRSAVSWAALADRSVADLLEERLIGRISVRKVVAACIDRAVAGLLGDACAESLAAQLDELSGVLDDRRWLVLSTHQIALDEPVALAELARGLGISHGRVQQLQSDAVSMLREALVDSRFRGVAAAAERLRARLGDGPVPRGEADSAIMAVTSADHDPLDERERELLLWCAGPYRAWGDDLVLRNTRVRAP